MNLDDAYVNGAYIPQADAFPPRWQAQALAFREALGARAECDVSYGAGPRQIYDFFSANETGAGTLVFVHGGYWRRFDKSYWSHFAQGALGQGWNVAMISYDLCPTVSIAEITRQVATAVTAIAARITGPISLTGHSAGGHLVSRMLAPGVLPDLVRTRIARVAPISPLADLRPLLQTSMNDDFRMDMADAEAESPVLQPRPDINVKIWVGAAERPAFLEQALAFSNAWDAEQVVVPEKHHFDIIDALQDPQSDMIRFLTGDFT